MRALRRLAWLCLLQCSIGCGREATGGDGGIGVDLTTSGLSDGGASHGDFGPTGVAFDIVVKVAPQSDVTVGQGEPWIGVNKNGFSVVGWTERTPYVNNSALEHVYLTGSPLRLGPFSTATMTPAFRDVVGAVDSTDLFQLVAVDDKPGVSYSRLDPAGKLVAGMELFGSVSLPGDRPSLAVGPGDRVAVAWREILRDMNQAITDATPRVMISDAHGATFTPPVAVPSSPIAFASSIAWAPDGALYLAAAEIDDTPPLLPAGIEHIRAVVHRSDTNGTSFAQSGVALPVDSDTVKHAGLDGARRAEAFFPINEPILAVAPNGRVVAVWAGRSGEDLDIFCSVSDDKGVTWSAPVTVNDDTAPAFHFLPGMTVDDQGRVHVMWADGRGSPTGAVADALYTPRYAISRDGGHSFSPSVALRDHATALHPPPADPAAVPTAKWIPLWVGDRFSITTRSGRVYPIWSDTSSGHAEVYLTTGVIDP